MTLELPKIIQAPMAGVSTPEMAAAVSNAGALGSIGVGATNAEGARKMIADFRARSKGALNVNVFCHAPAKADAAREKKWIERFRPRFAEYDAAPPSELREIYESFVVDDDMLRALVETKPEIVSFHFGVPRVEYVRALRGAGCALFGTATNVDEASALVAAGIDVIVAQGWEAGGHRGVFDPNARDDRQGTLALVRSLVCEIEKPIIAAGGIMNGAGITRAIEHGAVAAQLGTAFIACPESSADAGYRAALASDAANHTEMTRAISGRPARCLRNRFTAEDPEGVPDYPIAYDLGKSLHAAAKAKGDFGWGAQWAGGGAPLARSMPAADLVETLAREM